MRSPVAEELLRAVELTPGFVLLPVEVPGPDLARELGEWLTSKQHPCVIIEPRDDASWEGVVTSLYNVEPQEGGVVMVIGNRRPPNGVHKGLRLFNQNRGGIAKHLGCALFWCGPESFLDLTAESAPDFWSIRAMTRTLTTEEPLPAPQAPPTPEEKAKPLPVPAMDLAKEALQQGDLKSAARLTLRKARELLAEGELDEAQARLFEVLPLLRVDQEQDLRTEMVLLLNESERQRPRQSPAMKSRLSLAKGQDLLAKGSLRDAKEAFEEALSLAEEAGDKGLAVMCSAYVGLAHVRLGEAREEALRRIEGSLDEARAIGDRPLEALVTSLLAEAKALSHDRKGAEKLSTEADHLKKVSAREPTTIPSLPPITPLPPIKQDPPAMGSSAGQREEPPPSHPAKGHGEAPPPPALARLTILQFAAIVLFIGVLIAAVASLLPGARTSSGEHRYCFDKGGHYDLCTRDKAACERQRTVLYEDCLRLNKSRSECDKFLGACEERVFQKR